MSETKKTTKERKAAAFYAKATPQQARRRALRKYRVPLSILRASKEPLP